ncbi:MAG: LysE family translocator [Ignavibacteria bacterium]|jgi:threonine/homoserine/homoserine lactone efflux protein
MSFEIIAAFTIAMIILSASPGPGVFSTLAEALSNGFVSSMYFLTGLIIGDIFFLLLAIFGMSAVSILMGEFFFVIKIIGGLYLIFLGIQMWRNNKSEFKLNNTQKNKSRAKSLLGGLFITLGNPKAIIFYASLLPTIIDLNKLKFSEGFAIVLIVAIVSYLVIGTYSFLAVRAKLFLKNEKSIKIVNKTAGSIMIGSGAYILSK